MNSDEILDSFAASGEDQGGLADILQGRKSSEERADFEALRPLQAEPRIGIFFVDYDELSPEELAAPVPGVDELLMRSRVVHRKAGL